jgi:hypothetical protein
VASFISTLINNYNMAGVIAGLISGNPYTLWGPPLVASLIDVMGYTNVAQVLSLVSSSALGNIAINNNMSSTTLNQLITNAALSATAAQALLYGMAENYYYNKWIQTVTYNAPTSVTFSTNTVLSTNVLIAQNITIASGVTVTCGTWTCFFIAQSFNNQGTIVSYGAPGGTVADGAGAGGTGGGGIVVIAITAALGTLDVSGSPGGNAAGTTALSVGGTGGAGAFYLIGDMAVPIGGTGGLGGYYGYNGGGGGGAYSPSTNVNGGYGGDAIVYSFSSPNAMNTYILQGLSDWWLSNVIGKAPPSVTPLVFMYGSGGGGGSISSGYWSGGGGGGGGGEVIVYGYNILSGSVNAAGGAGGAGTAFTGNWSGGGGGGGGGLVFILYGSILSGNVTANVAGGAGGVGGTTVISGGTGANGTLYIAAVTVNG